jgi:hypothetical protein
MPEAAAFLKQFLSQSSSILLPLIFATTAQAEMLGPHAPALEKLNFSSLPAFFPSSQDNMTCLITNNNSLLIGLAHQVLIHAPMDQVVKVFEDYDSYADYFEPLTKSTLVKTESTKDVSVIDFVSEVPIPFVPDTHYRMIYKTELNQDAQKIYSFHLVKSKDLTSLDGLSVIKKITSSDTLYEELDFMDADWGVAKTLAPTSIWTDSIKDMINSDYALKIHTEEPSANRHDVKDRARKMRNSKDQEKCVAEKKSAESFLASLQTAIIAPAIKTSVKKKKSSI